MPLSRTAAQTAVVADNYSGGPVISPFIVPLSELRQRRSEKWTSFDSDVLPLHVAEMDVCLATPIQSALTHAIAIGDTGYPGQNTLLRESVVDWLPGIVDRSFLHADQVTVVPDVGVGVIEALRASITPGDTVVYCPPVYSPFPRWIHQSGGTPVEVPLLPASSGFGLDLRALSRVLDAGAKAVLLCSPHNPVGRVHPRHELQKLAEMASAYGATIVSDEIWAPLTQLHSSFVSVLDCGAAARENAIVVSSASKAWNLAGLKCAFTVTGSSSPTTIPTELAATAGHLGVIAAHSALIDGEPWLAETVAALSATTAQLDEILAHYLPQARWIPPSAGFVGWVDVTGYPKLGADPAALLLERARVAVISGANFGSGGAGYFRVNYGCSTAMLDEAFSRISRAVNEL